MSRLAYLVLVASLTTAWVPADSIRVGDDFYRDVYIGTTTDYYFVHHPEEGRIERVSRRRSNISDVVISEDAAYRDGLLARYRERAAAAPADSDAGAPVPRLDGELVKHRAGMKDLAIFEAQLAHWQTLPVEAREAIEAGLYETLEQRTAHRAAVREQALTQLQELGATKATVEQEWASAAEARAAAVQQARAEDESDFYMRAYENSKGYVGPYYHFYRDEHDNLRSYSTWWYTEDPSLYDAALAERSSTAQEIGAVEQTYAARASSYRSELDSVERAMTMKERIARSSVAKAIDDQTRFGNRQTQVAALVAAAECGYLPRLQAMTVASWLGAAPQRLPEFSVGRGPWKIDCTLAGGGSDEGFAVTVYNAETNAPFTRIAGPDFLGMRMRVFDGPGRFYLVVEQGLAHAPYTIEVSTLDYR